MLKLRLLTGPRAGRQLRVSDTKPVSIGRRKGRLRLHDSRVSKNHAEIYFDDDAWILKDLGSANGTYINRDRVSGIAELEPGDLIQMGRVLIKVVRCDGIGMDTQPELSDELLSDEALGIGATAAPPAEAEGDLDLDALFSGSDDNDDSDIFSPPADPPIAVAEPSEPAPEAVESAPEPLAAGFDEPVNDDDLFFADLDSTDATGYLSLDVMDEPESADAPAAKAPEDEEDPFLTGVEEEGELEDTSDQISLEDESGIGKPQNSGTTLLTTVSHEDLVSDESASSGSAIFDADAEADGSDQVEDEAPAIVGLSLDHAPPQQPEVVEETEAEQPEPEAEDAIEAEPEVDVEVEPEPVVEDEFDFGLDDDEEPETETAVELEDAAEAVAEVESEFASEPDIEAPQAVDGADDEPLGDVLLGEISAEEDEEDDALEDFAAAMLDGDDEEPAAESEAEEPSIVDETEGDLLSDELLDETPNDEIDEDDVLEDFASAMLDGDDEQASPPVQDPADEVEASDELFIGAVESGFVDPAEASAELDELAEELDALEEASDPGIDGSSLLDDIELDEPEPVVDQAAGEGPEVIDEVEGPSSDVLLEALDAVEPDEQVEPDADPEPAIDPVPESEPEVEPVGAVEEDDLPEGAPDFDIDAAFDALSEGLDDSFSVPAIGADQPQSDASEPAVETAPSDDPLVGSQLDVGFIKDALSKLEQDGAAGEAQDGQDDASPKAAVPPLIPPGDGGAIHSPPPGLNPSSLQPPSEPEEAYRPPSNKGRWFFTLLLLLGVGGGAVFYITQNYDIQITGRDATPATASASVGPVSPADTGNTGLGSEDVEPAPGAIQPPAPPTQAESTDIEPEPTGPNPFSTGPAVLGQEALVGITNSGSSGTDSTTLPNVGTSDTPGTTEVFPPAPTPDPTLEPDPAVEPEVVETPAVNEPPARIVFLVDASGSLVDSLPQMLVWLNRAIRTVEPDERFAIYFFKSGEPVSIKPEGMTAPTREVINSVSRDWLSNDRLPVFPSGRSNPSQAIAKALTLEPTDIYFLSDDAFAMQKSDSTPEQALDLVKQAIGDSDVRLHGVQFFYRSDDSLLETLANQTKGTFEFVRERVLPNADPIDLLEELGGE